MLNIEQITNIARIAHTANFEWCRINNDFSQVLWEDALDNIKQSAIDGVHFIYNNPDATASQTHENWLKFKKADGWVYGEVKDPIKKTHPCFVEYNELPFEQRIKDSIFHSIVRGMISAYTSQK